MNATTVQFGRLANKSNALNPRNSGAQAHGSFTAYDIWIQQPLHLRRATKAHYILKHTTEMPITTKVKLLKVVHQMFP